jgi:hypothetical protein
LDVSEVVEEGEQEEDRSSCGRSFQDFQGHLVELDGQVEGLGLASVLQSLAVQGETSVVEENGVGEGPQMRFIRGVGGSGEDKRLVEEGKGSLRRGRGLLGEVVQGEANGQLTEHFVVLRVVLGRRLARSGFSQAEDRLEQDEHCVRRVASSQVLNGAVVPDKGVHRGWRGEQEAILNL